MISTCIRTGLTRLFDLHGFGSVRATRRFLNWAEKFDPDIVWLHNIHGYYINVALLFDWLRSSRKRMVKWTLHDCWAFTGHCGYFTEINCDKWKTLCSNCPQKRKYPASLLIDGSKRNYIWKRSVFQGVSDMTLIVPSMWLEGLVRQSYLGNYSIEVRYNEINEKIFHPTKSNLRSRYGLDGKTIILGVANRWEKRKGLEDFFQLSTMLEERYVIILVGISQAEAKKRARRANIKVTIESLEDSSKRNSSGNNDIISPVRSNSNLKGIAVHERVDDLYEVIVGRKYVDARPADNAKIYCLLRTQDQKMLAKLYSMADYFVNATHDDNYPTTNLEAKACGTFVITYDVGGAAETLR